MANRDSNNNAEAPSLRFDATTAGVKDGGLRSVSSISILVSYIVANMNGRVSADIIVRALDEGQLANYFEVTNAIARLIESGTLRQDESGILHLGGDTQASIDLIEKDLPFTVRERSMHLIQKIIAKETYRRENEVIIVKENDGYTVNMRINSDKTDFMKLSLFAPTIDQANTLKERFLTNPVKVYDSIVEAIFANEE